LLLATKMPKIIKLSDSFKFLPNIV
jgi:hypothetical protein